MFTLCAVAATLLAAFVFHFAWWRLLGVPVHQIRVLILVFCVLFLLGSLLVVAQCELNGAGGHPWTQICIWWFYFALLYWTAAFCYVITYSAMEGDSPTLSLTRHLHRRGEEGVSHEEIEDFFRQRPFVGARVKALVTDNVFIEEQGGYRLSPGSYVFFRVILRYRRAVFGPIKSGG